MSVPDSTVEAAMRAAYDAYPQCWGPTGRPKTYEECYGMSPLANTDDANEMRIALQAALDEGGVVLASAYAIKQGECDALWDELATHKTRKRRRMLSDIPSEELFAVRRARERRERRRAFYRRWLLRLARR